MALEFDGKTYRTIIDVQKQFKVSAGTINRWIRQGLVHEPPKVVNGARKFRHFDDEWCKAFEKALHEKLNGKN